MDNPFVSLKDQSAEPQERKLSEEQRRQKRDAIYNMYSPMVNEVLDQLITAYQPGIWKMGSDCTHDYCCHIRWYAGPEEKYKAAYDENHIIRRRVEITLEQAEDCTPTGFKVTSHQHFIKSIQVGLTREELVRGIREVLAGE